MLVKAPDNNDIDGSQYHRNKINFGYNNVSWSNISSLSSIGGYEYFKERLRHSNNCSEGKYTGNQYESDENFIGGL